MKTQTLVSVLIVCVSIGVSSAQGPSQTTGCISDDMESSQGVRFVLTLDVDDLSGPVARRAPTIAVEVVRRRLQYLGCTNVVVRRTGASTLSFEVEDFGTYLTEVGFLEVSVLHPSSAELGASLIRRGYVPKGMEVVTIDDRRYYSHPNWRNLNWKTLPNLRDARMAGAPANHHIRFWPKTVDEREVLTPCLVDGRRSLSVRDAQFAMPRSQDGGHVDLRVFLNQAGVEKLLLLRQRLTSEGDESMRAAVLLDGFVCYVMSLDDIAPTGEYFDIRAGFSQERAHRIAALIYSGALPVTCTVQSCE